MSTRLAHVVHGRHVLLPALIAQAAHALLVTADVERASAVLHQVRGELLFGVLVDLEVPALLGRCGVEDGDWKGGILLDGSGACAVGRDGAGEGGVDGEAWAGGGGGGGLSVGGEVEGGRVDA